MGELLPHFWRSRDGTPNMFFLLVFPLKVRRRIFHRFLIEVKWKYGKKTHGTKSAIVDPILCSPPLNWLEGGKSPGMGEFTLSMKNRFKRVLKGPIKPRGI